MKECVEKARVNVSLTVLTPSREFRIPTFSINRLLEAHVGIGVAFRFIDRVLIEPDIEVKETIVTNQSKQYETLSQAQKALKIFMVPKFTSAAYFAATEKGAKQAVAELKGEGMAIDFLYTGPSAANTDEEIRITLVGAALVDVVAEQAGASARFAVVSTDLGAFSQNSWIAAMKAQMQAKYPKMQLVDIRYGMGKPAESFSVAQDVIDKFRGQLDAIVAPTVVALPKVAEAVEQTGLTGKIVVTGLSTPNDMKEFVKRGTVKTVVLWNPVDLGYLAVYVAQASLAGTFKDNTTQAKVPAGRLGTRDAVASLEDITAKGPLTLKNVIVLGNPFRFTKDNIDQFDF